MENIIIGCDCCRYTAEIAMHANQMNLIMGTIYCASCKSHPKFLYRIAHRLYGWYWVKRYLPND